MRGTYLAAEQLLAYQRLALRGIRQFSYLCCQGMWWQSSTAGQLTAVLDCKTSHAPGFVCLFGQNEVTATFSLSVRMVHCHSYPSDFREIPHLRFLNTNNNSIQLNTTISFINRATCSG